MIGIFTTREAADKALQGGQVDGVYVDLDTLTLITGEYLMLGTVMAMFHSALQEGKLTEIMVGNMSLLCEVMCRDTMGLIDARIFEESLAIMQSFRVAPDQAASQPMGKAMMERVRGALLANTKTREVKP